MQNFVKIAKETACKKIQKQEILLELELLEIFVTLKLDSHSPKKNLFIFFNENALMRNKRNDEK